MGPATPDRKLLLTALCMLAPACAALEGGWPRLAGPIPTDPVASLAPVAIPAPARPVQPLASGLEKDMARRLEDTLPRLKRRFAAQKAVYESAKARAPQGGRAWRTAQFELSRLGGIANAADEARHQARRLMASLETSNAARATAAALFARIDLDAEAFAAYLAAERRRLALLGDGLGGGAEEPAGG